MQTLLETALGYHQAGRLDQAETLYRTILSEAPDHADALHLLGVLAHQRGLPALAIERIEQAIALEPNKASYHVNLGEAYRAAGEQARAQAHYRRALELEPRNAEAHNNLALAHHQQGQIAPAVEHFEAAIEARPFFPQAYANLGKLLREQGRLGEAQAILREGLRLLPDTPVLLSQLGRTLLDMGQLDEAAQRCQEAVRRRPTFAEGFCHLGSVLRALGRRDEARAAFLRAIELEPAQPTPHHLLGQLAHQAGRHAHAIASYRQALHLAPNWAQVHRDLAAALYETDQPDQAVEHYRRATQIEPGHLDTYNSLGYVLQDRGDLDAAIATYRRALEIHPTYAAAQLNLGLALAEAGQTEEAVQACRQTLQWNPQQAEAYAALGLALRDRMPAAEVEAARALLTNPAVEGRSRAVLHYGLAQVEDARGHYAEAAEHVRQASAYFQDLARKRGQAHDPEEHRQYVDQIIAAYTPAHFERVRPWGVQTDLPVFVVGMPRSGTSLIEQILASHPQVVGAGELVTIRDCYRTLPSLVGKQAPGIACVGDLTAEIVQKLARRYLDVVERLAGPARRVVDKMPDNYLMLGLIVTLFPRARIIHSRRDLRDTALSCWMTYFRHIYWSFDMEHIGGRIRDYLRLMEHWRQALPVPMLEVDYEETVADLEGVARRLVDWCGLEWDPACLAFYKTRRPVRTASMIQVREPIYTRSVHRWRNYQDHLAPLDKYLPPEGEPARGPE